MSNRRNLHLSPIQEGLIGGVVGAVLGGVLALFEVISPLAVLGVIAGVALGSWFNARRRARHRSSD